MIPFYSKQKFKKHYCNLMCALAITSILPACTSDNKSLNENNFGKEQTINYPPSNTNSFSKTYTGQDYLGYDKIIFHKAVSIDQNSTASNEEFRKEVNNALEEIKKKHNSNPGFKQWFFFVCRYKFGYGTSTKKILYSDLYECQNYSCEPEDLVQLKDQWIKNTLLNGQAPIDYKIHIVDGYYSYASDLRLELINHSEL